MLLDVVPGRIWAGDFRPVRDMRERLVGADGDLAAHLRVHPEDARALYRAAVPRWWNTEAAAAYGMPDRHPADIMATVSDDALSLVALAVDEILSGQPSGQLEFRAERPDASLAARRLTWARVGDRDDPLEEIIMVSLDEGALVAEQARRLAEIAAAALTDPLTGLPNRAGLARSLDEASTRAGTAALIAFDVPSFRAINEVYGQDVGDRCLRTIARVLADEAAPGDVAGRLGGDQFAVLLQGDGAARAEAEVVRLTDAIERAPVAATDAITVPLHVVGGIASVGAVRDGSRTAPEVLADVGIALSYAKRIRSTVRLLDADGDAHRAAVARRLDWGRRLREAIADDTLVLLGQPVVNLQTGEAEGFELLTRLRVGDDLVPAGTFIHDINLLGLTPLLDRFVAARAVALTATHAEALGDRRFGFNVSVTTLVEGDLLGVLDRAVDETGGDLTKLVVEMTETEMVGDLVRAREVAEGLHDRGLYFALDDFGAGAAVPEVLRALPVDMVKIDGRFVAGAARSALDRAATVGAVALADALGIPVVAEWIEDAACLDLMRSMGVAFGQGVHLGRPGALPEVLANGAHRS